jgi:hypothetical protein
MVSTSFVPGTKSYVHNKLASSASTMKRKGYWINQSRSNRTQEMKKNNDPKTKPQPGGRIPRMFHERPKTPSHPSKLQFYPSTRQIPPSSGQSQQPAKPSDSEIERQDIHIHCQCIQRPCRTSITTQGFRGLCILLSIRPQLVLSLPSPYFAYDRVTLGSACEG